MQIEVMIQGAESGEYTCIYTDISYMRMSSSEDRTSRNRYATGTECGVRTLSHFSHFPGAQAHPGHRSLLSSLIRDCDYVINTTSCYQ